MVQNFQYGQTFNPQNVFVDDVYIQIIPPTGYLGGAPTSISASTGTGSWGYLNTPQLISSPSQNTATYGGVTAAAINGGANGGNDVHDLCTDIQVALTQATGQAG